MISCKRIGMDNPMYQEERKLLNEILLRHIGIPDHGWDLSR